MGSNAAIASPPQNQPQTVTTKMAVQSMDASPSLHEAPHVSDIGENNPKRGAPSYSACLAFVLLMYT